MTRPDLDAIRARCEAATPGPWKLVLHRSDTTDEGLVSTEWLNSSRLTYHTTNRDCAAQGPRTTYSYALADTKFICHARTDIPALLAYIDELESLHSVLDAERAKVQKLEARDAFFADACCHYRNLAITLGAKPDQMIGSFDRKLCESGIDPNETSGGYHTSVNEELDELKDTWSEVDMLRAEIAVLRGVDCGATCVVADGHETTRGRCGVCRKCAFRRGAEVMRQECYEAWAKLQSWQEHEIGERIISLPIPEEQ